jgi:C-terminal processing protease CtpA/Prc
MNLSRCRILPALALVIGLAGLGRFAFAELATPGDSTHALAGIGIVAKADVPLNGSARGPRLRDHLIIGRILDNGPADRAHLRAGDEIVEIDGIRLAGMHFIEAVADHLRGPLGSVVKVTIVRPGQPGRLSFDLVRDIVPVPPDAPPSR